MCAWCAFRLGLLCVWSAFDSKAFLTRLECYRHRCGSSHQESKRKKKASKVEPGSLSLHADRSPAFKIPLNKLSEIHSTLHQERLAHSRFHSWYEDLSPAYTDAVHNCGFAIPIQFSSWSLQSAQ